MTGPDGERLTVLFTESSRNFGGQERRLLREALWLLEAGHRVRIASPPEGILCERARSAGVPVDAVPMRGSAEPGSLLAVLRILRLHRIDVIYSHSGKDSWIGGFAGLLAGAVVRLCREAGLRERLIAAGRERANDFDVARGMERLVRHFREVAR